MILASKPPKIALSKFDATFMNERIALAAEMQLVDDGSGFLRIWRIKKSDCMEIAKERHGMFYSGDTYVVLYSYEINSKQKHILYYWLVCSKYRCFQVKITKQYHINNNSICWLHNTIFLRACKRLKITWKAQFLKLKI